LWSDLLTLIRETENDDLTGVLQKFVCEYADDIVPLAVEITTHLVRAVAINLVTVPWGPVDAGVGDGLPES